MFDEWILDNGLRVVGERLPHLRSVSIGLWVKAGSALETSATNGLSHFLEHMAFKGTEKRTARMIAEEMDAVGGYLNAATSKLCTNYYAKIIDEDLPLAADILADITLHPAYDPNELEKERGVVLEEIAMVEDSPEDVACDVLSAAQFADSPIGLTILGDEQGISSYTRAQLVDFHETFYGPCNAVLAVCGNYDPEALKDLLNEKFGAWRGSPAREYPDCTPRLPAQSRFREKDTEQINLCVGYPGIELGSRDNYAMAVLNAILGGSMSSRLFQRVREESGLAYSIYSSPSFYPGCGDLTVCAGTTPKNASRVMREIDQVIAELLQDGVTDKEFSQARSQLRGGFVLGQESAYSRMNSMGHNLMLLNRVIPAEETIKGIEDVKREDVMRLASILLTAPRSLALVGRGAEKLLK